MYANFFGFKDIPFRQLSDPRHVYMSAEFESARSELLEAIRDDARLMLLTGHAGTGKTKLLRHLHAYLEPSRAIFYLPFSPLQIQTFIAQTASELDMDIETAEDPFQAFQAGLREMAASGPRPIMLIDDAHNLGGDVLENLIDLFELSPGSEPLAQLVMAAHPEIEYTLERPELRELEESMARLSRLQPLSADDVGPYITFALRSIGYDGEPVFTQEAIRCVAAQTRGVPQLIGTLCEAAFLVAYGRDQNPITPDLVEVAVEEVAGFAMGEDAEQDIEPVGEALEWIVDTDEPVDQPKLPGVIDAWLKRSRRWPIAAIGVGSSVALASVLVLLGTVPFEDNAANARIRNENTVLIERMDKLRDEVRVAHQQRDELQTELEQQRMQRDQLEAELAVTASADEPADVDASVPDTQPEPVTTTAEQLLEELMASAPAEAEVVTSQQAGKLGIKPVVMTHKVVPGDTLWSISQRYGVKVEDLMALNNIAPGEQIIIGRQLELVAQAPSEQVVLAATVPAADAWYTVKAGDSLYGIGRQFDSSVDELKRWNQLADAKLLVGQKLRIAQ